jgi:hypothetical protein
LLLPERQDIFKNVVFSALLLLGVAFAVLDNEVGFAQTGGLGRDL